MSQLHLFDLEPTFTERSVREVTFQGKMGLPIHRWYRLTPSFSPKLAWDIADYFKLSQRDLVLDPFSGVGTVSLCMKYRGIPSCSIEINPYLCFVSSVKTRTYRKIADIESCLTAFAEVFARRHSKLPRPHDAQAWLNENRDFIPPIHNAERWWSPGNLMQLVCLRRLALEFEADPEHRDLIRMGILGILVPVSNAKHNHVSLTFADKPLPTVDLRGILAKKLSQIVDDLQAVQNLPRAEATIHFGNSKHVASILPRRPKVSAVITSPPYPNRFSYARETRPHLFFFDFIADARAVGELETDAIGGTWGKATSVLAKRIEPGNSLIAQLISPYTDAINGSGELMANYVTKYFNDIFAHAGEVAKVCKKRCRLAYVIGNSKFYNQPLPSDEILAGIFEHHGFALERIDRMRKRQSKRGLHEAVVFMHRQ